MKEKSRFFELVEIFKSDREHLIHEARVNLVYVQRNGGYSYEKLAELLTGVVPSKKWDKSDARKFILPELEESATEEEKSRLERIRVKLHGVDFNEIVALGAFSIQLRDEVRDNLQKALKEMRDAKQRWEMNPVPPPPAPATSPSPEGMK